jgi:hypothetical protein
MMADKNYTANGHELTRIKVRGPQFAVRVSPLIRLKKLGSLASGVSVACPLRRGVANRSVTRAVM